MSEKPIGLFGKPPGPGPMTLDDDGQSSIVARAGCPYRVISCLSWHITATINRGVPPARTWTLLELHGDDPKWFDWEGL